MDIEEVFVNNEKGPESRDKKLLSSAYHEDAVYVRRSTYQRMVASDISEVKEKHTMTFHIDHSSVPHAAITDAVFEPLHDHQKPIRIGRELRQYLHHAFLSVGEIAGARVLRAVHGRYTPVHECGVESEPVHAVSV